MNPKAEKTGFITAEEIQRLVSSPVDTKVDIAQNIAKYYKYGDFEEGQIKIAEQVLRALLKDTEIKVRKTLSESIKDIEGIPHDVVMGLAHDIGEVSLPVLEFSDILSDADLIDIISSTEGEQQHIAITKRKKVTEKVSDALIDTKSEQVVGNLMQNKNAEVSERGYIKAVEDHKNSEMVLGSMVERGSLPVTVVEKITSSISNELYKQISEKHPSSMEKLAEAVKQGSNVATMQVMGLKSSEVEYREFTALMKTLKVSEELVPVAALCMANLNLFEISVAKITKVPVLNIRELMKDESNKGFQAIYSRAELPVHLYEASALLLGVLREFNGKPNDNLRLSREAANRFIEKIIMKAEENGKPENFDYLLSLVKHTAFGNK